MAGEQRTLEIVTRVRDFASRTFATMGQSFSHMVQRQLAAGFRTMGGLIRQARSSWLALGAVVGTVFVAVRAQQGFRAIIDAADRLRDLAIATGSNVEQLSVLQRALQFTGLQMESFSALLRSVQVSQGAAIRGNAEAARSFRAIGISVEELHRLSPDDLFVRITEGLSGLANEAERTALAQVFFGRRFQEVLPLLQLGPKALAENVKLAKEWGAELRGPLADAADAFNDELVKLSIALDSIAREAVLGLAQEFRPLITVIAEFVRANREGLTQALQGAIRLAKDLVFWLGDKLLRLFLLLAGGGDRWLDGLIARLRQANILGKALAGVLEAVFGQGMSAGVRAARQEIDRLAESVASVELTVTALRRAVAEGREEGAAEMLAGKEADLARLNEELARAEKLFEAAGRETGELGVAFGSVSSGAAQTALDIARLRQQWEELRLRLVLPPGERPEKRIAEGLLPPELEGPPEIPAPDPTALEQYRRALEILRGPFVSPEVQREALEEIEEYHRDFFARFTDGVERAILMWRDFASAAIAAGEAVVDVGLNAISDAFADLILGAKSWSEAFKDAAKVILQEIARLIPRLLIIRALSSFFGAAAAGAAGTAPGIDPTGTFLGSAAKGGIGPGVQRIIPMLARGGVGRGLADVIPLRSYQRGGVARQPTFAVFGEAGEEAFVPLENHRIPVEIRGQRGGDTFIFAPVVQAWDSRDARRALWDERATIMALWRNEMRLRQNRREVKEAI